jgi:hypothetical protein
MGMTAGRTEESGDRNRIYLRKAIFKCDHIPIIMGMEGTGMNSTTRRTDLPERGQRIYRVQK